LQELLQCTTASLVRRGRYNLYQPIHKTHAALFRYVERATATMCALLKQEDLLLAYPEFSDLITLHEQLVSLEPIWRVLESWSTSPILDIPTHDGAILHKNDVVERVATEIDDRLFEYAWTKEAGDVSEDYSTRFKAGLSNAHRASRNGFQDEARH